MIQSKAEANQYLFDTSWHEIVRMTTGDPIPDKVAKKRKEAYEVLRKAD